MSDSIACSLKPAEYFLEQTAKCLFKLDSEVKPGLPHQIQNRSGIVMDLITNSKEVVFDLLL